MVSDSDSKMVHIVNRQTTDIDRFKIINDLLKNFLCTITIINNFNFKHLQLLY